MVFRAPFQRFMTYRIPGSAKTLSPHEVTAMEVTGMSQLRRSQRPGNASSWPNCQYFATKKGKSIFCRGLRLFGDLVTPTAEEWAARLEEWRQARPTHTVTEETRKKVLAALVAAQGGGYAV